MVTYPIPAKPPKYFVALENYVSQSAATSLPDRSKIKYTFDRVREVWPQFRSERGKKPVKKTPEEKAAAQRQRLHKQISKPEFWQNIQEARMVVPELKTAARLQQRALRPDVDDDDDDDDPVAFRRARRPQSEDDSAESDSVQEDSLSAESDSQTGGQDDDESDIGGSPAASDAGDNSSTSVDSVGDDDDDAPAERKRKRSSSDESVEVKSKRVCFVDRAEKRSLQEQLKKKVSAEYLQQMRARTYQLFAEHKVEGDGEFAKLFDNVFETIAQVNAALGEIALIVRKFK